MTLWQLLTAKPQQGIGVDVPALTIKDAPRFAWRGLMLDSARHFQSPEYIKQFIDWMALHKLNVLHWHLTDDQAWRLEIKKYPRLTTVGAWRVPAGDAAKANIDPATGKPRVIGGFYTQDQVREIVAYAADAPHHGRARDRDARPCDARRSSPIRSSASAQQAAHGRARRTGASSRRCSTSRTPRSPSSRTCSPKSSSCFPSEYIHVGGDEARQGRMARRRREIQARMQASSASRTNTSCRATSSSAWRSSSARKGRKLIGWDEILEGGLAPNATVMSWRGIDGAIAAAKAGHDTVLSPAPDLYLDTGRAPATSPGRSNTLSLEMVYKFDPVPDEDSPSSSASTSSGVQANLWAEIMRSEDRVTYMAFPRAAALAEVAWSPPEPHRLGGLPARLRRAAARATTALGIRYATRECRCQRRRPHGASATSSSSAAMAICCRSRTTRRSTANARVFLVNITEPVLDLRAPISPQVAASARDRRPDPVQLPDRQGRGRHSAAASPRRATASSRCASTNATGEPLAALPLDARRGEPRD